MPSSVPSGPSAESHCWNVERTDEGVRVCFGDHDKAQGCDWRYFVPAEALDTADKAVLSSPPAAKWEQVRVMATWLQEMVARPTDNLFTDLRTIANDLAALASRAPAGEPELPLDSPSLTEAEWTIHDVLATIRAEDQTWCPLTGAYLPALARRIAAGLAAGAAPDGRTP